MGSSRMSALDNILMAAFEFDVHQVIKASRYAQRFPISWMNPPAFACLLFCLLHYPCLLTYKVEFWEVFIWQESPPRCKPWKDLWLQRCHKKEVAFVPIPSWSCSMFLLFVSVLQSATGGLWRIWQTCCITVASWTPINSSKMSSIIHVHNGIYIYKAEKNVTWLILSQNW